MNSSGGFVYTVSATQEPHLNYQIAPALEFLSKYEKEFARLKRMGVDNMLLDFGMEGQQTKWSIDATRFLAIISRSSRQTKTLPRLLRSSTRHLSG